uniref:Uncharacterized protein n=1 Tax=Knipowitschia caucasica TaxID=637954 RepID=A0AAV2KLC6_KNICA
MLTFAGVCRDSSLGDVVLQLHLKLLIGSVAELLVGLSVIAECLGSVWRFWPVRKSVACVTPVTGGNAIDQHAPPVYVYESPPGSMTQQKTQWESRGTDCDGHGESGIPPFPKSKAFLTSAPGRFPSPASAHQPGAEQLIRDMRILYHPELLPLSPNFI